MRQCILPVTSSYTSWKLKRMRRFFFEFKSYFQFTSADLLTEKPCQYGCKWIYLKLISYSDIHYMRMLFQCKYSNSFQDSNIHILLASLYNICITLSIYYCVYVIPKTYNNSRKFCIFVHWLSIYICCTESIDISLKNLSCNICSERYTFCGLLDCSKNRFPLLLWKFIPEASGLRAEIAFHEQDQWRTHFKPRGISEF